MVRYFILAHKPDVSLNLMGEQLMASRLTRKEMFLSAVLDNNAI